MTCRRKCCNTQKASEVIHDIFVDEMKYKKYEMSSKRQELLPDLVDIADEISGIKSRNGNFKAMRLKQNCLGEGFQANFNIWRSIHGRE